ncbi:1710_t:CDS:2, partial [Racocetra persica]
MKPTLVAIFCFFFIAIAVHAQKPSIDKPVAFHEVLPLPVLVTKVGDGKFSVESKWVGTGFHPNELVFKRMSCEDGVTVDATNVKGVFSDKKHTFTLTVPKGVSTV